MRDIGKTILNPSSIGTASKNIAKLGAKGALGGLGAEGTGQAIRAVDPDVEKTFGGRVFDTAAQTGTFSAIAGKNWRAAIPNNIILQATIAFLPIIKDAITAIRLHTGQTTSVCLYIGILATIVTLFTRTQNAIATPRRHNRRRRSLQIVRCLLEHRSAHFC